MKTFAATLLTAALAFLLVLPAVPAVLPEDNGPKRKRPPKGKRRSTKK